MRRLSLIVAAAYLIAATAHAATAPTAAPPPEPHGIAVAFGNTVKALYADGRYQRIWFQPDGAWDAIGRRGQHTSGHWRLNRDGKVCMSQTRPFPAIFHYCAAFPADGGLGVVWTAHDWRGEPMRLTVVKGIEKP